jgi:hypothetical protein
MFRHLGIEIFEENFIGFIIDISFLLMQHNARVYSVPGIGRLVKCAA